MSSSLPHEPSKTREKLREELDLVPDCTRQALVPRYPGGIFAEIE
jgi:hypothetical protein